MLPHAHHGLTRLEMLVVLSLGALLVAATLPRVIQLQRAPGQRALHSAHHELAIGLGEIHGRWLRSGSSARTLVHEGRILYLNGNGWPTLDREHPDQDSAAELYAKVVGRPLTGESWRTAERPAPDAGLASFELRVAGGGEFVYEAETGYLSHAGARER